MTGPKITARPAIVRSHHELDPGAPGERYQVVVHVDAPALADRDQPSQSVLDDHTMEAAIEDGALRAKPRSRPT